MWPLRENIFWQWGHGMLFTRLCFASPIWTCLGKFFCWSKFVVFSQTWYGSLDWPLLRRCGHTGDILWSCWKSRWQIKPDHSSNTSTKQGQFSLAFIARANTLQSILIQVSNEHCPSQSSLIPIHSLPLIAGVWRIHLNSSRFQFHVLHAILFAGRTSTRHTVTEQINASFTSKFCSRVTTDFEK